MAKRFRIGNDLYIRWNILKRNEGNYDPSGKTFNLYLFVDGSRVDIDSYVIYDGHLEITFPANKQKLTGTYSIQYEEESIRIDERDIFTLVPRTWMSDEGEIDESQIVAVCTTFGTPGQKGDKGDKGDTGPVGPRGFTGDSGYTGAAGELRVADSIEDKDATAALSAHMGKFIYDDIYPRTEEEATYPDETGYANKWVTWGQKWNVDPETGDQTWDSGGYHAGGADRDCSDYYPLEGIEKIKYSLSADTATAIVSFWKSYTAEGQNVGQGVPVKIGTYGEDQHVAGVRGEGNAVITSGEIASSEFPSGAVYVQFCSKNPTETYTPYAELFGIRDNKFTTQERAQEIAEAAAYEAINIIENAEYPEDEDVPGSGRYDHTRVTWGGFLDDGRWNWGGYHSQSSGNVTDCSLFYPLNNVQTIKYALAADTTSAVISFWSALPSSANNWNGTPLRAGTAGEDGHVAGVRGQGNAVIVSGEIDKSEIPDGALYVQFSTNRNVASFAKVCSPKYTENVDFEPIKQALVGKDYTPLIGNGTSNNGGNQYAIRSNSAMYAKKGDVITVTFNRPLLEGQKYRYVFVGSDDDTIFSSIGDHRTETTIASGIDSNKYVVASEATICINVSVYLIDVDGTFKTLQPSTDYSVGDLVVTVQEAESLPARVSRLEETPNAYERNKERAIALGAACRERKKSETSKDFQMLIVTDTHADAQAMRNAVEMANGFASIDCLIHLGDEAASFMHEQDAFSMFTSTESEMKKPFYNVIGNHEGGTINRVGLVPSKQHMYDVLIKPMVDNGYLEEGEYVEGNCYYYHDFTDHNMRLIVINEYDGPLTFDERYWVPVTYSSSDPLMEYNTTYSVGDVIRVPYHTDDSFECVQEATTGPNQTNPSVQEPRYEPHPKGRMISATQAQWFLDTLLDTPANYGVIVAMHQAFSRDSTTYTTSKFCQNLDASPESSLNVIFTEEDFIADAVDAFMRGVSYSDTIHHTGVSGDEYNYTVSANFANKNSGVKFMCYLGGHFHKDLIWKHDTYDQYMVAPICANAEGYVSSPGADIRRSRYDGYDYDSITTIAFNYDSRTVSLTKLGVNVTEEMTPRDYEKLDLNQ